MKTYDDCNQKYRLMEIIFLNNQAVKFLTKGGEASCLNGSLWPAHIVTYRTTKEFWNLLNLIFEQKISGLALSFDWNKDFMSCSVAAFNFKH